jgi:hypothetical protein
MLLCNTDEMTTTFVSQWNEKYESARRKDETHQSAADTVSTTAGKVNFSNNTLYIISEQRSKECDWIKESWHNNHRLIEQIIEVGLFLCLRFVKNQNCLIFYVIWINIEQ